MLNWQMVMFLFQPISCLIQWKYWWRCNGNFESTKRMTNPLQLPSSV